MSKNELEELREYKKNREKADKVMSLIMCFIWVAMCFLWMYVKYGYFLPTT